jgi:NAD(P)-dependent dehydrogenase (short-subunit alcohol dehydrogenase family)
MDLGLTGRTAVVTGAGSQIGYGRGIVMTLAQEGCNIIATDIDLEGARQTAAAAAALGVQALALRADVSNRDEVDTMVQAGLERFNCIDILVNNAGTSSPLKPFAEMTRADWDLDIQVNLYGQMNVAQALLPHMMARNYGRIINFSGGRGIPNISIYGAAKAGIIAFTEALAREVAAAGVIVNGIVPGLGETGLVQHAPREFLDQNRQRSTLKRLCRPEDVGPVVAFLASDVCSYMTGQFIHLSTF